MKTEFKGTKGKWEVEQNMDEPIHTIWNNDNVPTLIARTCFAPASLANAQLIAASPDLLEEMQSAMNIFKDYLQTKGEIGQMQIDRWEYVINKALGL